MASRRRGRRNSASTFCRNPVSSSRIDNQIYQDTGFVPGSPDYRREIQTIYDLIGELDRKQSIDIQSSRAASKHLLKQIDNLNISLQHVSDHYRACPHDLAEEVKPSSSQPISISSLVPYLLDKAREVTDIVCELEVDHPIMVKLNKLSSLLTSVGIVLKHVRKG